MENQDIEGIAMIRTHYDNLKVARNAPPEVIRAAYKTLSQKYHPDRYKDPNASRIMAILNEAYEVLSSPEKRRLHDLWINQQESVEKEKANDPAVSEGRNPDKDKLYEFTSVGRMRAIQLTDIDRDKLMLRVKDKLSDQVRVKTDGVILRTFWSCIFLLWFVYLFNRAMGYGWSNSEVYWMMGITIAIGMFLGSFLVFIYRWWTTPFKSFLLITPLYVIKTEFDEVKFWPLQALTELKGTHNYRNGMYENTSISLNFGGEIEEFSISPKKSYQDLVGAYNSFYEKARRAAEEERLSYFIDNDDFYSSRAAYNDALAQDKSKEKGSLFGLITLLSALLFYGAFSINRGMPKDPGTLAIREVEQNDTQAPPENIPVYRRPEKDPNGKPWPTVASYIGSNKIKGRGLSSVTVDNSKNDSDVLVKLFSHSGRKGHPVRTFFIPAFSSFKLDSVKAGVYDVRYRDLDAGTLLKSETFTVAETETYTGAQYSNITMTLYKVVDGNMQTYDIDEKDF